MLGFRFWLVGAFLVSTAAVAAIDVRTSITDVGHESNFQAIGSFTLAVKGDDFPSASYDRPNYIRFKISEANGWAVTVVDLRDDVDTSFDVPINLALRLDGSDFVLNPDLPEDAVQLVRLIKGEREGWIRINYPSGRWLKNGISGAAPNGDNPILFSVGIRGESSVEPGGSTDSGGNEYSDTGQLAGTVLYADYRNTPSFEEGDRDRLDFIAFDALSRDVEEGDLPLPGANLSVGFSDDNNVARGVSGIACLETHTDPVRFDAPPSQIGLSRFNLTNLRTYSFEIPDFYITNTSDFNWQAGTWFRIREPVDPWQTVPFGEEPAVRWRESEVRVITAGGAEWEVRPTYDSQSRFNGYEIHLRSGVFAMFETIQIKGMVLETYTSFRKRSFSLKTEAYYVNRTVTDGALVYFGALQTRVADLSEATVSQHRLLLPYTAYDRADWQFQGFVTNPSAAPVNLKVLFYDRNGILLRVHPKVVLEPHSQMRFRIEDLFGDVAGTVLAWVEVLSEEPLLAGGLIEDKNKQFLDVFPPIQEVGSMMRGLHLPAQTDIWETRAYLLDVDLENETDFYLDTPTGHSDPIRGLYFPGGTVVLKDPDFQKEEGRLPWFQISATEPSASGRLFFFAKDMQDQLTSIPLSYEDSRLWTFNHLGNSNQGWWNALVMLNPGTLPSSVTVNGYGADGVLIVDQTVSLAAGEKWAGLVETLLNYQGEIPLARLVLRSDRNIAAFLLMGNTGQEVMTSIPGNTGKQKNHILPFLGQGQDRWSGVALHNDSDSPSEVSLTFYKDNGLASEPFDMTIEPHGKRVFTFSELGIADGSYAWAKISASQKHLSVIGLMGGPNPGQLATLIAAPADEQEAW